MLVVAGLALSACMASASPGKPSHLTCDSLDHPLGIDSAQPLLSWQLQDGGFAARQTAYRIEVASTPSLLGGKPDVWDSGRITSDKSFGVTYWGGGSWPPQPATTGALKSGIKMENPTP
jgi:alpha-L-rhamnosidase